MKTINLSVYRVLFFLIIVSFVGIGSCKKKATDPDYCGTSWAAQVSSESAALTAALQTYATDPTTPNCNALKAAYQNYLDALSPFVDCASWTAQQQNELQAVIDAAEQEIDTLCE
jgi:hypothetical protein